MANICSTEYRITGEHSIVKKLWRTLERLGVNEKSVWLCDLAKAYNINYEKHHIHVRGQIYWACYQEDNENDDCLLCFSTETAWTACTELFDELRIALKDNISISYREIEQGCELYYVHDECDFFPEECCVSADGEPFDNIYEEPCLKISDAIELWSERMNIPQGERTTDEMMDFINNFEYEEEDTYFTIHRFVSC